MSLRKTAAALVGFARFAYLQRVRGFDVPTEPHLDPEALQIFSEHLRRANYYLEFGSGGSTVAAARAGVPGLSVESDAHYAETIRRAVGPVSSIEIITAGIGLTRKWSNPVFTRPTRTRLQRWRGYSAAPFSLLDGNFPDFVLIDGRFRRACALETARQAEGRAVAMLFDDYFSRASYRAVESWLGKPQRHGRAALFDLSSLQRVPTEDDIWEASRDYH